MSYILDALKKAERERHLAKIPTLETVHRTSWQPRRSQWLWIAVAVAFLNVALLAWLFRRAPIPEKPAETPTARVSTATLAERPAPTAVPESPAPPSRSGPPLVTVTPPPEPAPPPRSSSRRLEPAISPEATRRSEAGPVAPSAPSPIAPSTEATKPRAPFPPAVAPAPAPEPPAVAAVPDRPATPPVTVTPSRAPGRPGPVSALQDVGPGDVEGVPKLTLQFLVYSETPQERLVFINNQKYLEGQSIDGKILVEGIQPDGVVLSYQGKRFRLRQ